MSPIGAGYLGIPEKVFLDTLVSCIESTNLPELEEVDILYHRQKNAALEQVRITSTRSN
jgi:hypothetical protein